MKIRTVKKDYRQAETETQQRQQWTMNKMPG